MAALGAFNKEMERRAGGAIASLCREFENCWNDGLKRSSGFDEKIDSIRSILNF